MAEATALASKHQIRPLPFQPARLKGLSERLIVSHHENNHGGAVRNLNRVEEELSRVTKDTPPPIVAALKERELTFQRRDVRTYRSGNHTQACAFGQPLLVLDMYEYSYALDYGAAAAKYVDAFFQNVNWDELERRLEAAGKAAEDLRR